MEKTRYRILAIDDTPANLKVLATALSSEFSVQLASSGPEGLAIAEAAPPDIILLDVMMPDMDGFETCRRFKANPALADIPVVFVTALADGDSELGGIELGAVDYLRKPINVAVARQRIKNIVEREAYRQELVAYRDQLERLVLSRTSALSAANAELSRERDRAESSDRAKSAFLASVGHELRTPLNIMMGMAELARADEANPLQRERLTAIGEAGRHLLGIIGDIQRLIGDGQQESETESSAVDLGAFLDTVVAPHRSAAQAKGLSLVARVAPGAPRRVLTDPRVLGEALRHLLSNAVKFSERGEVSVTLDRVAFMDGQDWVRVSISDQGPGISRERIPELFEAFARGDDSLSTRHQGLGLGLAVCLKLVRRLGGSLSVESEPGHGSCFSVDIPVVVAASDGREPRAAVGSLAAAAVEEPSVIGGRCAPDPDARADVARLLSLLHVDDTEAIDLWRAARPRLESWLGEAAVPLEREIRNYDFGAAESRLAQLVAELD